MKLRLLGMLAGLAGLAIVSGACGDNIGLIPNAPATPTPCSISCTSPEGPTTDFKEVTTDFFSVYYNQPPLTEDTSNSDTSSVVFNADTAYGQTTALLAGTRISGGVTASSLLQSWISQNLDTTRFSGLKDAGPILGAEIGYQPGAGRAYTAIYDQPGVPNFPVFIQVIAATKGTTGLVFAMFSPLDPLHPDPNSPRQVRGDVFDRLINTVAWR